MDLSRRRELHIKQAIDLFLEALGNDLNDCLTSPDHFQKCASLFRDLIDDEQSNTIKTIKNEIIQYKKRNKRGVTISQNNKSIIAQILNELILENKKYLYRTERINNIMRQSKDIHNKTITIYEQSLKETLIDIEQCLSVIQSTRKIDTDIKEIISRTRSDCENQIYSLNLKMGNVKRSIDSYQYQYLMTKHNEFTKKYDRELEKLKKGIIETQSANRCLKKSLNEMMKYIDPSFIPNCKTRVIPKLHVQSTIAHSIEDSVKSELKSASLVSLSSFSIISKKLKSIIKKEVENKENEFKQAVKETKSKQEKILNEMKHYTEKFYAPKTNNSYEEQKRNQMYMESQKEFLNNIIQVKMLQNIGFLD